MKKHSVGGQAVIEGVMMKNQNKIAVAVRKQTGDIEVDKKNIKSWVVEKGFNKIPFLRGGFILFETMAEGIKSLNFSAQFFEEEEAEPSQFENFLNKIFNEKTNDVLIYFSLFIALIFSILLFILLPTFLGGMLKHITESVVVLNLFEGLIRIGIFLAYVYLISLNEDIKRVFQYHGAEHKSIYCYEKGLPLTVENARKFSTLHPRCGTNFMFIVMIMSLLIYSLFGWPNPIMRVVYRLLCLPIVAGISYEIIKLAGKFDNKLMKMITFPGMMLQKVTTREPDDKQLEVALCALKAVVDEEVEGNEYKTDNDELDKRVE
ncbi:DUF1385 domain-containing protein [Tepidibacter formicigenes]|jgi:uncharacterized protein YqhQ|uniref:Uncharacterized conserved protein YqhQ n=1 Tax=Tepidibacter formicigenes DSM 15518 TaxID=1123349 RepID=A0A1M6MQ04_9FIRM|nr:DUF1385 domain-containing protein [Tepidibacter formicigenes]SHJ85509.1 Uncharacterized conserved protein YqhQ [Tepidibacter formicigenes DSM 15518]